MKRAILLMNMGGPSNLDEVEIFLSNMFNDRHVINAPQPIRKIISKLITWQRSGEAKANYMRIGGKSPIQDYTNKFIKELESKVDATVHMVMRYTPPFASDVLQALDDADEIYAIPLYPHYSRTTTLSSIQDLKESIQKQGIKAELKTLSQYYKHPDYMQAIVERIQEQLQDEDPLEYELVFSAHGLPQSVIDGGDTYQRHIKYNLYHARRALTQAGIHFHKTHLAYQSRLGPMEWIRPYLEDKLASLQKRKVIIYPIAFTMDNSETEFELDIEYREIADGLGFETYKVAKAPNDNASFVKCIHSLYEEMKA